MNDDMTRRILELVAAARNALSPATTEKIPTDELGALDAAFNGIERLAVDPDFPRDESECCADAILAADWRKLRTITTVEELDELPKHSTIITQYECVIQLGESTGRDWRVGFVPGVGPMRSVGDSDLPALVLWTPGGAQ